MSLNTSIVLGSDPIHGQPMEIDPIGQESSLPVDVARIIFKDLKAHLPTLALVCKNWTAIIDDKEFRQIIRPAQAFGTQEWKEYIGVDAGKAPPLPRRAYGDLEKEGGLLTFIPEIVKVIENGKEVALDNLKAIGNLVNKPKKGFETGYKINEFYWPEAIEEKRKLEKPHWVWIKKEVLGLCKNYEEQQAIAKEENKKACGANISGVIDTAISVFMEYVRSGERNFIWDLDRSQRTFVRVNETSVFSLTYTITYQWAICLGFIRSGLLVSNFDHSAFHCVGFVTARKSFAT